MSSLGKDLKVSRQETVEANSGGTVQKERLNCSIEEAS